MEDEDSKDSSPKTAIKVRTEYAKRLVEIVHGNWNHGSIFILIQREYGSISSTDYSSGHKDAALAGAVAGMRNVALDHASSGLYSPGSKSGEKSDDLGGANIKEEPDFFETHCHWVGCDREFGTQDALVKVREKIDLYCMTHWGLCFLKA